MEPEPQPLTGKELLYPKPGHRQIGKGSTLQPVSGMNIDHGPKPEATRTADSVIDAAETNGSEN